MVLLMNEVVDGRWRVVCNVARLQSSLRFSKATATRIDVHVIGSFSAEFDPPSLK